MTIERARTLVDAARRACADSPDAIAALDVCARRLDEPLRIALAGSLKAGKSTLLNALVGQDIAPTDATECTRVVTWYRRGAAPTVTAHYDGGRTASVPVLRRDGRLTFDLAGLTADRVDRLDVDWPTRTLQSTTIIDTPGISSSSREVSARTAAMLTPETSTSGADAVVYLLRSLTAADTAFMTRIAESVGGDGGPLGVVGVLSRADEAGAGRLDAMISAAEIAGRVSAELDRMGLCQAVVPVAGLLALGARTLTESEFSAFSALAQVPSEELAVAMLSADRFARPEAALPVDAATRARLVERYGLYGIRSAVTLIRLGTSDSSTLATELVQRSGLAELRQVIDVQFGQRADQLKTHSALVALERVLATCSNPTAAITALRAEVAHTAGDVHGFTELRLLARLRARPVELADAQRHALMRIIGGYGIDAETRLGLEPDEDTGEPPSPTLIGAAALESVRAWRALATHPLTDPYTARACAVAVRSAEAVVAATGADASGVSNQRSNDQRANDQRSNDQRARSRPVPSSHRPTLGR